jgi:UDP-N-acetylmuramate dehydrogenase
MTPLQSLHTFGTEVACEQLFPIYSDQDIFDFLLKDFHPYLILGGGSNVLFTSDYKGSVLLNRIKGIEVVDEDHQSLLVSAGSGEVWHNFVMWSVGHELWGLENLALIPGTVGAAPMQNIGAYGVEQERVFHSLEAIDLAEGTTRVFYKNDCHFGYRESFFKREGKGKYFITKVNYLLSKTARAVLDYADVAQKIAAEVTSPVQIAEAVIEIRKQKLPDPKKTGNAGSFFKNPVVGIDKFNHLRSKYPNMPAYEAGQSMKLAAGWLIDQCGFKGVKAGNTGTYQNQALVLVNNGGATGSEILQFAQQIQNAVQQKFDVALEMEVNVIGS